MIFLIQIVGGDLMKAVNILRRVDGYK